MAIYIIPAFIIFVLIYSFFKKINDKWAAYLFKLIEIYHKKNYGRTES